MSRLFLLPNGRAVALDEHNCGTVEDVQLDVDVLLTHDFAGFLDMVSHEATGTELLQDIVYTITHGEGTTITFRVSGDFSTIVDELREE